MIIRCFFLMVSSVASNTAAGETAVKTAGVSQVGGKYIAPGRRDGGAARGETMTPRTRGNFDLK